MWLKYRWREGLRLTFPCMFLCMRSGEEGLTLRVNDGLFVTVAAGFRV